MSRKPRQISRHKPAPHLHFLTPTLLSTPAACWNGPRLIAPNYCKVWWLRAYFTELTPPLLAQITGRGGGKKLDVRCDGLSVFRSRMPPLPSHSAQSGGVTPAAGKTFSSLVVALDRSYILPPSFTPCTRPSRLRYDSLSLSLSTPLPLLPRSLTLCLVYPYMHYTLPYSQSARLHSLPPRHKNFTASHSKNYCSLNHRLKPVDFISC